MTIKTWACRNSRKRLSRKRGSLTQAHNFSKLSDKNYRTQIFKNSSREWWEEGYGFACSEMGDQVVVDELNSKGTNPNRFGATWHGEKLLVWSRQIKFYNEIMLSDNDLKMTNLGLGRSCINQIKCLQGSKRGFLWTKEEKLKSMWLEFKYKRKVIDFAGYFKILKRFKIRPMRGHQDLQSDSERQLAS